MHVQNKNQANLWQLNIIFPNITLPEWFKI